MKELEVNAKQSSINSDDDLSSHAHRQLIGSIGLVLPPLLWLLVALRPIEELHRWEPLGSVSAYYHTGAVSAFSGALVALALFLFSYRGYDNEYRRRDRVAAIIAGIAAIMVAFFPTEVPEVLPTLSWWTPRLGLIHNISAVVLFCSFAFFALFQFPKSEYTKSEVPSGKRARNRIFFFCGGAMIACMLWAAIEIYNGGPIFWPETLALEFFAVSWLVKGRVDRTAAVAGGYMRHPRRLLEDARRKVREL